MMTSAPRIPSSSEAQRFAPGNSSASGARLAGDTKRSSPTPSVCSAVPVERATREWRMSPTTATHRFCRSPLRWRMVSTSSSPRVQHADVRLHVACDEGGQAGLGVAHHEYVHHHRLQRVDGVEHGLTLHARGGVQVQVDHVRAEACGSELEGDARARARLEEQVRHGAAEQRAVAGGQVAGFADVELREVEQLHDFVTREAFEREQVAQAAGMVALQVSAGVSLQDGLPKGK